ncbi:MAG: PilZ domain-containing protein [Steroidobacteraceae bacterium]|nr:PilZ domain-containing protein [Steroidobacteraceae bacterium]
MSASGDSDFTDGLHFDGQLSLAFEGDDAEPLPATLARLNADNLQVLQSDASLAESHRMVDAKDEERPWLADLARLEFKLDVLLGTLGRVLAREAVMPAAVPVRMYAGGIEWLAQDDRPVTGARGRLTLYVNPSFPQPLQVYGRVIGYRSDGHGLWAQFAFGGLSAPVVDMLERLVFRQHRRQVAGARGAGA